MGQAPEGSRRRNAHPARTVRPRSVRGAPTAPRVSAGRARADLLSRKGRVGNRPVVGPEGLATVDSVYRTGNEVILIACQENNKPRHLLGRAEPFQWGCPPRHLQRALAVLCGAARSDVVARRDGIDAD